MTPLRSHYLRAEIDRLEILVYELDHGPCTEAMAERIHDVGLSLCELASEHMGVPPATVPSGSDPTTKD